MKSLIDTIQGYLDDTDYLAVSNKIYCPFCGQLLNLTLRKIGNECRVEYEWRYCRSCQILYWCPSGFGYLPRNPIEVVLKRVEFEEVDEI